MKHTLALLLCTILTIQSFAQADNRAKTILDKAVATIKALPAVEIVFELSMINTEEHIQETHPGKAYMKNPMYRIDVMDTENYFDGEVIYTYMPEAGEVCDGFRTMQCISLWEGSPEGEGQCRLSQERRIQVYLVYLSISFEQFVPFEVELGVAVEFEIVYCVGYRQFVKFDVSYHLYSSQILLFQR